MELKKTALVIADISGYTKFISLHRVSLLHAEAIITDLLNVVTQSAQFPLKLNALEGDAAFLYCDELGDDHELAINDIAQQIVAMMDAFAKKHRYLLDKSAGGCLCDACQHVHLLRLKAFAHVGDVVIKTMNGKIELGGEAPIVIHRLTKNNVQSNEYVLLTDAFAQLVKEPLYEHSIQSIETDADLGDIPVTVFYPKARHLEAPTARRLSKLSGIMEAARLFWKGFQAATKKRQFNNLPS